MVNHSRSAVLEGLPRSSASLLSALHRAQQSEGFISDDAILEIAAHTRLTSNEIEGVVSGFPDFRRTPKRPHLIRVCDGMSCRCGRSAELTVAIETATADDRVDLEHIPCLFACTVGPVMEIDGALHGRLTPETASAIIRDHLEAVNDG